MRQMPVMGGSAPQPLGPSAHSVGLARAANIDSAALYYPRRCSDSGELRFDTCNAYCYIYLQCASLMDRDVDRERALFFTLV